MKLRHGSRISLAATTLAVAFISLIGGEQVGAQLTAPTSVVTNTTSYWGIRVNNNTDADITDNVDSNRTSTLLDIATNGIIVNDRWDTCCDGIGRADRAGRTYDSVTDFAGLYYGTPSRFDTIEATIHNYGDGGDWEAMPNLYILKIKHDTGGSRPETNPYWVQVTGQVETTGHVFAPIAAGSAEQTISFDLSSIDPALRTGYGWALGGVDGTARSDNPNIQNFISIAELSATGLSGVAAPAMPSIAPMAPLNVVSNIYHSPHSEFLQHNNNNRGAAFDIATNGVIAIDYGADGDDDFVDTWDTYQGDANGLVTDFAGLYYGAPRQFETLTAHTYATHINDGGTWEEEPKVYILRANYDTNQTRPEAHPYWEEVTGATITRSPAGYDAVSVNGGAVITVDLSSVPAAQRRGYGWALGGVDGTQASTTNTCCNFIHVSELEATGTAVSPGDVPALPEPTGTNLVPINVLSNQYTYTWIDGVHNAWSRGAAFEIATNGVIQTLDDRDEWETTPQPYDDAIPLGDTSSDTDFAGLYYSHATVFDSVTAHTFTSPDYPVGGEWSEEPKLYLLVNNVDTDQTRPEEDTENWVEVTGATLTYDDLWGLQEYSVGNGNNFFTFDLSGLAAEVRTGYGWAIGGVNGTKSYNGIGNFISITELEATGTVIEIEPTENADFNGDNIVDGTDFLIWQVGLGLAGQTNNSNGDADGDGVVDGADLVIWKAQFGDAPPTGTLAAAIPEPATALLAVVLAACLAALRRRTIG